MPMKPVFRIIAACFAFVQFHQPSWAGTSLSDLPARQWSWVDVDGAYCANGSSTGFAVNPTTGARQVLLYLQGGGMCTDETSCWGPSPTAANLNGYNAESFAAETFLQNEIFQRGPDSPFSSAVMAFVPYCTGDLHIGTGPSGLPTTTWFVGGSNLQKYMDMLHAAYPSIEHVWLVGASAGGAGAILNQWFTAQTFQTQVDVIDDSAPPMAAPNVGVPAAWHVRIPPGCTACAQDLLTGYYAFSRTQLPASRFAFLDYVKDTVLPGYFQVPPDQFQSAYLETLRSLRTDSQARLFLAYAQSHVVLTAPQNNVRRGTMRWLSHMARHPDRWVNRSLVPR